jgi:CRP-like cAMP-binding protein
MSKCEQCIVRELSALKSLTREELVRMAQCKSSVAFRKGDVLFREGERVNGIYCVRQGACKLTKIADNGNTQIIRLVKKGELLGQRSTISDEPANLGAVAIADMEACFIPKNDIIGFIRENGKFSLELMRHFCSDLRESDDNRVVLAQENMSRRLALLLLDLYDAFGTTRENVLDVALSRDELGALSGMAAENVTRILSGFKKDGIVSLEGKKIIIGNRAALQRVR